MTTLAVAAAVLLLGIPGLVMGSLYLWNQSGTFVEQRAKVVAETVDRHIADDERVTASTLEPWTSPDSANLYIYVVLPDLTLVQAGEPRSSHGAFEAQIETSHDALVTVVMAKSQARLEVAALLVLGVAGIGAAFGLGVWLAMRQSRKITAPLIYLAATAEQIGAGQVRPRLNPSGMEEIDLVYNELIRTADRMAGRIAAERQFAADASHQLRTPLTALSMRLEEIEMISEDPEVVEEARQCLEQVDRLGGAIDGILAKSRAQAGGTTEAVAIDRIFAQQAHEWAGPFKKAGRTLSIEGNTGLAALVTPGTLGQVIATLVENSLKYGAGTTTVAARAVGKGVVVTVSDEGTGVDPDASEAIFTKGFSTGGSTGIGLAVARELAEADGARLELAQNSPPIFQLTLRGVPRSFNPDTIIPQGAILQLGSRRKRR